MHLSFYMPKAKIKDDYYDSWKDSLGKDNAVAFTLLQGQKDSPNQTQDTYHRKSTLKERSSLLFLVMTPQDPSQSGLDSGAGFHASRFDETTRLSHRHWT